MCNNNTIKLYDEGVRVMGGTLRLLCYKKKKCILLPSSYLYTRHKYTNTQIDIDKIHNKNYYYFFFFLRVNSLISSNSDFDPAGLYEASSRRQKYFDFGTCPSCILR